MPLSPRLFRYLLNCYPPYLGAGISVQSISEDWKTTVVLLKLRWYNRNAVGTHFGGSLYSMVDPHIMLMLMRLLGKNYIVWDSGARIEYIKAAKTQVTATIQLTHGDIESIKQQTQNGDKCLPEFTINLFDSEGQIVAKVYKTLYVRKKKVSKN